MPCYHPLEAWQTFEGEIHFYAKGSEGKGKQWGRKAQRLRAKKTPNYRRQLNLPCGKCVGCRLERSKIWSIRLMHEAQLHERKCFLTLTYENDKLPSGPAAAAKAQRGRELAARSDTTSETTELTRAHALNYAHFQQFMKSLRNNVRRRSASQEIRFYMCGEYGEKLHRPHYHAAIYGEDFADDRYVWKHSSGNKIYRSSRLESLWPHGYAHIGELTTKSAAYMARYIMKKITGDRAPDHYRRIDPTTGEEYFLPPEFNIMSRRPGIGKDWLTTFKTDVYPGDFVLLNGHKVKPPRYYDKLLEDLEPLTAQYIKDDRENRARPYAGDNTPARLAVKEQVALARLEQLKRPLEK